MPARKDDDRANRRRVRRLVPGEPEIRANRRWGDFGRGSGQAAIFDAGADEGATPRYGLAGDGADGCVHISEVGSDLFGVSVAGVLLDASCQLLARHCHPRRIADRSAHEPVFGRLLVDHLQGLDIGCFEALLQCRQRLVDGRRAGLEVGGIGACRGAAGNRFAALRVWRLERSQGGVADQLEKIEFLEHRHSVECCLKLLGRFLGKQGGDFGLLQPVEAIDLGELTTRGDAGKCGFPRLLGELKRSCLWRGLVARLPSGSWCRHRQLP